MKAYKLKHIPTGLYYTPSKSNGNLSKRGKVYVDTKPRVEWTKTIRIYGVYNTNKYKRICEYFNLDCTRFTDGWLIDIMVKTNSEDWAIEELL